MSTDTTQKDQYNNLAALISRQSEILDTIRDGEIGANGEWVPGPLYWLWNFTKTFDEHWTSKGQGSPYAPFPKLPYMPWLLAEMCTAPILFIPKSRQMMVSWAAVGYAVWRCQQNARTRVIVQSQKLEKAQELVKGTEPPGYARTLYEHQPEWLKRHFPLADKIENMPADKLIWANGSAIQGVGAGAGQIRTYHPTLVIFDEMAFMDEAEGSFGAALPVAQQMIAVSSAGPGFFAEVCSRE